MAADEDPPPRVGKTAAAPGVIFAAYRPSQPANLYLLARRIANIPRQVAATANTAATEYHTDHHPAGESGDAGAGADICCRCVPEPLMPGGARYCVNFPDMP